MREPHWLAGTTSLKVTGGLLVAGLLLMELIMSWKTITTTHILFCKDNIFSMWRPCIHDVNYVSDDWYKVGTKWPAKTPFFHISLSIFSFSAGWMHPALKTQPGAEAGRSAVTVPVTVLTQHQLEDTYQRHPSAENSPFTVEWYRFPLQVYCIYSTYKCTHSGLVSSNYKYWDCVCRLIFISMLAGKLCAHTVKNAKRLDLL